MSGFPAWLLQRLTAVYLAIFTLLALILLLTNSMDASLWQAGFKTLWVKIAVLFFIFSLLLHAWVGIRDVIVDYIHPLGLRLFALSFGALFLILNGFWMVIILWGTA